jgi:hypothetical protein
MLKHEYDGEGHSSVFRTQSLKLDSLVSFFITIHLWNWFWLFPACQSQNFPDLTSSNRTSLLANMGLVLGELIPDYCHFLCPLTLPGSSQVMLRRAESQLLWGEKFQRKGGEWVRHHDETNEHFFCQYTWWLFKVWCHSPDVSTIHNSSTSGASQFATCGSVWQDHLFCCFLITTQMSLNLTQMFLTRIKYCLDCCC